MAELGKGKGGKEGPKRILAVGSRSAALQTLSSQLSGAGYEVVQSSGPAEAIERLRDGHPDLLVLDLKPKEIEESGLWELVRSDAELSGVPVIVLIGAKGQQGQAPLQDGGVVDFLSKSCRERELLRRVRLLLRFKELHDDQLERQEQVQAANRQLERVNMELGSRNRELEQGLAMAHKLQDALLPQQYPDVRNILFCHKYIPADMIGGDLFQVAEIGEDQAALFVSDVSGHGVRAALVTSAVKAMFDHVDFRHKTPGIILCELNDRFRRALGTMAPQIYATAFLLFIDGQQRRISTASAGHPCPLVIRRDEMQVVPAMSEDSGGPALGFLRDPTYESEEFQLSVGDIVLGFTDGVYDVQNPQGDFYGHDRMIALIERNARLIARDLIQKILTDTEDFMGSHRRPDDVCMVAVESL